MLAPDPRSKLAQGRETNNFLRFAATGVSFLLHAAALAGLVHFRNVTPPEPIQVVAVELVYASDLAGISDGITVDVAVGSRAIAPSVADSGDRGRDRVQVEPAEYLGRMAATSKAESPAGATRVDDGPDHLAMAAAQTFAEQEPMDANQRDTAVEPAGTEPSIAPEGLASAAMLLPQIPRPKPILEGQSSDPIETKTIGPVDSTRLRAAPRSLAAEAVLSRSGVISSDEPIEHKLATQERSDGTSHEANTHSSANRRGFDGPADHNSFAPPRFGVSGLSNPPPRYPYLARRQGQEGRVVLRVRVSARGDAKAVAIQRSSGYRLLDEAALEAVRKWRFVPASRGGSKVPAPVDVPISFKLTD